MYDKAVLEVIAAAVSAGDLREAFRVVGRQPDGSPFQLVAERAAIQVRGCEEGVVAIHIPLAHLATPALLAAVATGWKTQDSP